MAIDIGRILLGDKLLINNKMEKKIIEIEITHISKNKLCFKASPGYEKWTSFEQIIIIDKV